MNAITIARSNDRQIDSGIRASMYRLRHSVFHDRLGWDVTSDNGMEHDAFDNLDPVYVLVRDPGDEVRGCWRLLPTTGPYMLKDVFGELLHGRPAPKQRDVWEMSRFAVAAQDGNAGFGFTDIPLRMMQTAWHFAQQNGIRRYVTVTSVSVERMMRKTGLPVERFGPPLRIGRVLTVACSIEVDAITQFALFGTLPEDAARIAA